MRHQALVLASVLAALSTLSPASATCNPQSQQQISCQLTADQFRQSFTVEPGCIQQFKCDGACFNQGALGPVYGGSNEQFGAQSSVCSAAAYLGYGGQPIIAYTQLSSQVIPQGAASTQSYNGDSYTVTPQSYTVADQAFTLSCPPSTTPTPSGVKGDPAFTGFLGQEFQVHGIAGNVYNIISTPELQFNTRFIFMGTGRPLPRLALLPDLKTKGWSHAGNYMGEVALQIGAHDRLYLVPGLWENGWKVLQVNGQTVSLNDTSRRTLYGGQAYVERMDSHRVLIHTKMFDLILVNADNFYNIDAMLNINHQTIDKQTVDGLLGHTAHTKDAKKFPINDLDDYGIEMAVNDLWSDDFVVNRFTVAQE